jgi:hypothetical protein
VVEAGGSGGSDILTLEAVEALVGCNLLLRDENILSSFHAYSYFDVHSYYVEASLYRQPPRSPVIDGFLSARPRKLSASD